MIKKKLEEIISKAEEKIKLLQSDIKKIESEKGYTNEYKLELIGGVKNKCITLRNKVIQEGTALFNSQIEKIKNEDKYKGNFNTETLAALQMISLTKDFLTKDEVEKMLINFADNNVVVRVLIPIAQKLDIKIDSNKLSNDTSTLEVARDNFIRYMSACNDETIENLQMNLFMKSLNF